MNKNESISQSENSDLPVHSNANQEITSGDESIRNEKIVGGRKPGFLMRKARMLLIVGILLVGFMMVWARVAPAPQLGIQADGELAVCPPSPNVVSTHADNPDQRMPPVVVDSKRPIELVIDVLSTEPRVKIVEQADNYLRAEFRSLIFGFVDDVEFLADPSSNKIHFRSASRIGHSDLGANRKRMTRLTDKLKKVDADRMTN